MGIWSLAPSTVLRFVKRDGRRILQCWWAKSYRLSGEWGTSAEGEWRDVPLQDEATPIDAVAWSEHGYT